MVTINQTLKNRIYSLNVLEYCIIIHYSKILKIAGLLYFVKVNSMFGICSEFAMISMQRNLQWTELSLDCASHRNHCKFTADSKL